MMSFVLNLSRSAVIKERFTSASRQSNVERSADDIGRLRAHGEQLQGAVLHGYLFFGTCSTMLDQLRASLPQAKVLMLDFWHVHGVDASSVMVLRKLLKLAAEARVQVVFTGLSVTLQDRLTHCGLDLNRSAVHQFPDLDRGLEWAEESLFAKASLRTSLKDMFGGLDAEEVAAAESFFETITVAAGQTFIRSGEAADRLYLVLEGRVSIYLQVASLGYRKRLRSYGTGTIVGEMGLYNAEPRSADISADVETKLAVITRAQIRDMEISHPRLASRLHRLVVLTLAARLRVANGAIQDLSTY
jgi:SulP family sulfate permease